MTLISYFGVFSFGTVLRAVALLLHGQGMVTLGAAYSLYRVYVHLISYSACSCIFRDQYMEESMFRYFCNSCARSLKSLLRSLFQKAQRHGA